MRRYIALFISSRKGFFREEACINCLIDKFCACDDAYTLFDIDRVLRQGTIDIGEGVRISKPLKVEKGLIARDYNHISLSHRGILAIYAGESSGRLFSDKRTVQFTDLNNDKQVEIMVKNDLLVGFYDEMMLLLTHGSCLKEATVEDVFENPYIETFKKIEGTKNVLPWTDVSLLHKTRVLYYPTIFNEFFSFNVDTRVNTEINVGQKVGTIGSLAGVDCGVKAVFCGEDSKRVSTLNLDSSVTKVSEDEYYRFIAIFPLDSNPENIKDAVFMYEGGLARTGKVVNTDSVIEFNAKPHHWCSIVRVYKDAFLGYDEMTGGWVVFRLIVF